MSKFETTFEAMPLIAILRGVRSTEVVEICEALHSAGVRLVEVPMNSPDPVASIKMLQAMQDRMLWGAGTVLATDQVDAVASAGGQLVVSPNTNPAVIRRSLERKLIPMPGFATASEAFTAIDCGARHLKLFPASTYGPAHLKALKAVLPAQVTIIPVGGVGPQQMAEWWTAGARGFGLGSEIFKPGMTATEVQQRASQAVAALRQAMRA